MIHLVEVPSGTERLVAARPAVVMHHVTWSHDGEKILTSTQYGTSVDGGLLVVDRDGRGVVTKVGKGTSALHPAVSADGKTVAFTAIEFSNELWWLEGLDVGR